MADEYCWNCETRLPAQAGFCPRCGSPVLDPAAVPGGPGAAPIGPAPMYAPGQAQRLIDPRLRQTMTVAQPFVVYAGFWRRIAALFIDSIIVGGAHTIVSFLVAGALAFSTMGNETASSAIDVVTYTVMLWLYFTLMESSTLQATVGKMALRIVVTDLRGQRMSWGKVNARFWAKILSGLILMIGYIMAGFTDRKQALHDIIAGTLVVKR